MTAGNRAKFGKALPLAVFAGMLGMPMLCQADAIQPGRYSVQTATGKVELPPGMPESMKKTLSEPSSQTQCVTPEKAAKFPVKMFAFKDGCNIGKGDDTGHSFDVEVTCPLASGGTSSVKATGTYTSHGFAMDTRMSSTGAHPMTIEKHSVAERTGDCTASDDTDD